MTTSEIDKDKRIAELEAIVKQLLAVIVDLNERLAKFENKKNSHNSSLPPSHDLARPLRTKSLREPSGKKPGGQPGHEGKTLEMVDNPDDIIVYKPCYCNKCGLDLSGLETTHTESRQEIVLPVIKPKVVEHQVFKYTCSCGHTTTTTFPEGITSGISYSQSIEDLVVYLSVRQYVPFHRMAEIFKHVFNVPISVGALVNTLVRVGQRSLPAYNLIQKHAEKATVCGGDETGMKLNGAKGWFWTIQGKLFTYIIASLNRSGKTLDEKFVNGFAFSVLVHDCWKSYFKITAMAHQICLAHLLRELNFISECYKLNWSKDMKELFLEAMDFKKNLEKAEYRSPENIQKIEDFENRLSGLLLVLLDEKQVIAVSFQKRLLKYRDHIFTFLYHYEVPPDNNGSERAIRNVKVKQKISGQFKSFAGAETFAVLRSIIDTAIKNKINPLVALAQVNSISLGG